MLRATLISLPPPQRRLWEELGALPRGFVLYGGTALAVRYGHRRSEDFDFFSNEDFVPADLEAATPFLRGAIRLQSSPNTLVCRVEREGPVKISFFGGLALRRVRDPEPVDGLTGLRVAAPLDLAATKAKVVQDRAESKDYLDLDRLMEAGVGLPDALGAARAVYGANFNPLLTLKALCYFGDGDLESLAPEIRARLRDAVARVDVLRLPAIAALPGGIAP
jgi:hypothetical protein